MAGDVGEDEVEQSRAARIADLFEQHLLDRLEGAEEPMSAAEMNVIRSYLRDQGFVRGSRAEARMHRIRGRCEQANADRELPVMPYRAEEGV